MAKKKMILSDGVYGPRGFHKQVPKAKKAILNSRALEGKPKKKIRIPVVQTVQKRRIFSMELPAAMFEEVEAFRFRNRFSSRTAAIRWMIDYALKRNHKINVK